MDIRKNEPLCRHTTLRVGGPAHFFVAATTAEALIEAMQFARKENLPIFILGGGSNVWASDHGFDGLVIKIATKGIAIGPRDGEKVELVAEAGEDWDGLVGLAVEQRLHGLENMSLIPGTVGAAVAGNIGAYGAEVKDVLLWAEALDTRTHTLRRFTGQECQFVYRSSFFKTVEGRNYIVVRAAFCLRTAGVMNLKYKDVQEYFAREKITAPDLAQVREAVISIRRQKLPDVAKIGTAGSFFKNPIVSRETYTALAAKYQGLPGHPEGEGSVKIPLGWILDKVCGLKGHRQGRVATHSSQALVIVNEGDTATNVEHFADHMASRVKEATGLEVEWEVERVE